MIELLGYFLFKIDTSTLGGNTRVSVKEWIKSKKLGKLLEVDGATVCRWERNENIPLEKHMKKLLRQREFYL